MRKLAYIFTLLAASASLFSCEKDEERAYVGSDLTSPTLKAPANASTLVITEATKDQLVYFAWSTADFQFPASIDYLVQVDKQGNSFKAAKTLGKVNNNDTLAVKKDDLNNTVLGMLADPEAATTTTLDVRVIAIVNSKVDTLKSASQTYTVTPFYKPIVYAKVWVPGNYQAASGYTSDWSPSNAPYLASLNGDGKYEGYVNFAAAPEFKFTSVPDWNGTNYGDGGAGKISSTGDNIKAITTPGYYRFKVNTNDLSYSFLKTSWGVIGDATAGKWDTDQNMTYNTTTKKWTITLALTVGEIKFRANDGWDLNYGSELAGKLKEGGPNIKITAAGNYTITMDLSVPPIYRYTVVKN